MSTAIEEKKRSTRPEESDVRQPARQSKYRPDCRAAKNKLRPAKITLHDCRAATIINPPRQSKCVPDRRLPIQIVALHPDQVGEEAGSRQSFRRCVRRRRRRHTGRGAEFMLGREKDGLTQPITSYFRVLNVNVPALIADA